MSLATFRKGIHPSYHKDLSAAKAVESLPVPEIVEIPLLQHLGVPARMLKAKGETVVPGELIAEASGMISANIHSSVHGEIKRIVQRPLPGGRLCDYVEIAVDREKTDAHRWERKELDLSTLDRDSVNRRIRDAGIVGMGGATFPTNVKLTPPPGAEIDTLVVNGAECEPYLTCDHRLMVENARGILDGIRIIQQVLGFKSIIFGIENNKPDAIAAVRSALDAYKDLPLSVVQLAVKYPQGGEKMLIYAVTGRVVPAGSLPLDVGVVVSNVQTLNAIGEAFYYDKPLVERILTVSGDGVTEARNLRVLVGTPIKHVVEYCGGYADSTDKILFGGPMMGIAVPTLDYSVMKGTSGLLFLSSREVPEESPCLHCARCVDACPMNLMPLKLAAYAKAKMFAEAKALNVNDCFECGACAYSCPAKIRLVSWIRYAKNYIRVKKI
ncbi:MAG TPA: electron transport complex subunit RsxC [Spirochaetia bacterium]|nr:electron transport complex subunit RsxC [Spirochaetia bacterium]